MLKNSLCFVCCSLISFGSYASSASLELDEQYILTVPFTDYQDTPGIYQNAVFIKQADMNSWALQSVDVGQLLHPGHINSVEVLQTDDVPQQVFLKVQGSVVPPCTEVGEVSVSRTMNTFFISLFESAESAKPGNDQCVFLPVPYTKIIPLPVYGLDAGTYQYEMNNDRSGNFELAEKNEISE